jgi:hypothetical protein
LQLGEQPCRQISGGFSTSQTEQQGIASLLAMAGFVTLLRLIAARLMSMTTISMIFRKTDGFTILVPPKQKYWKILCLIFVRIKKGKEHVR